MGIIILVMSGCREGRMGLKGVVLLFEKGEDGGRIEVGGREKGGNVRVFIRCYGL